MHLPDSNTNIIFGIVILLRCFILRQLFRQESLNRVGDSKSTHCLFLGCEKVTLGSSMNCLINLASYIRRGEKPVSWMYCVVGSNTMPSMLVNLKWLKRCVSSFAWFTEREII